MKNFTADLISRFGADDPSVYAPAEEEWDQVCERYASYIDSIKGQMAAGLRCIEEKYLLHDARIQAMGRKDHSFLITLQLDTPPQSIVTFTFDLVDGPVIDATALPLELRSSGAVVDWQYDELELLPGEPPTWSWSILLSNGWEVKLLFRDVQVQELQAMIPAPRNGKVDVATLENAGAPESCAAGHPSFPQT
jgi:hypothetical protein